MKKEVLEKLMKGYGCSPRTIYRKIQSGELKIANDGKGLQQDKLEFKEKNGKRYIRIKNFVIPNCKSFLGLLEFYVGKHYDERADYLGGEITQIETKLGRLKEHASITEFQFSMTWRELMFYATLCSFFRVYDDDKLLFEPEHEAELTLHEIYEAMYQGSRWIDADKKEFIKFIYGIIEKRNNSNTIIKLSSKDTTLYESHNFLKFGSYLNQDKEIVIKYPKPIFLKIAEKLKQVVTIPVDMLRFGRNTETTMLLKTYLTYRIALARNKHNKMDNTTVLYKTVYRDLGVHPDERWMRKYMSYLVKKSYVKSFKQTETKITWDF